MLVFASCSSNKEMDADETVAEVDTAGGAAIVDTIQLTATVTAIDAAERKVTLKGDNGATRVVKCGPEVVNFPQIEVGGKVKATYTEELAVYLGVGEPPNAVAAAGIALAPVGSKPGAVLANAAQISAKVTSVDAATRHVTLELPDGSSKAVKVGKHVNLDNVKAGDTVTAQYAESVAITVEAP
jgi:hypothetical protein